MFFSNYYFYDTVGEINDTMAYIVFANTTQQYSAPVYGAYLHEMFLK